MVKILSYLWQLPQNLLGLLLFLVYSGSNDIYESAVIRRSAKMRGGISLGRYIIVSKDCNQQTFWHEYGHCRQSMRLGWLYLIVIGLPSILYAAWWSRYGAGKNYYAFYTERWADKLGGVKR